MRDEDSFRCAGGLGVVAIACLIGSSAAAEPYRYDDVRLGASFTWFAVGRFAQVHLSTRGTLRTQGKTNPIKFILGAPPRPLRPLRLEFILQRGEDFGVGERRLRGGRHGGQC
jgi:hypothetical protein